MTSSSLASSLQVLVDEPANGNAAFEAAFDRHAPALRRYLAVRAGGDEHLADDLMQQLWLQVSGSRRDVPSHELEFWFRGIARNLIREHWRRTGNRANHRPTADPAVAEALAERLTSEQLPLDVLERKEVREQLLLALTSLPTAEQELIIGHYFHGRSQADLAEVLGLTARAIEGRLYRARRSLLEKLRELDP